MATVASPASAPKFLLVDAEALADGGSNPQQQTWLMRPQALDSIRRLAMACKLLRERLPDTKQLIFVEELGITQLQHCWQSGLRTGIEPSCVQCVPFGCHVVAVMLELARVRASHGFDVAVFSNNPEVVTRSREADTRWRHQGFMFIEGDLILPTAAPLKVDRSLALQSAPSVRRTISKCQRGSGGNRRAPPGWKRKGNDMEEDSGTLPDSQIDGVPLEETPPEMGEAAQPAEALGGGDLVPAPPCADQLPDAADLYADTLVDGDPKLALYRSISAEVDTGTAQQSEVPTDGPQALGSMPPPPVPQLIETTPHVQSTTASADEEKQEVGGRTRSRSPRMRERRETSASQSQGQDDAGRKMQPVQSETPPAAQVGGGQSPEVDALEKELAAGAHGSVTSPVPILNVDPTLPAVQMMDGSFQQESPAVPLPFPEASLLGNWVRDGGRRHAVVKVPGPAGPYLEFRQKPHKSGDRDEAALVKLDDNVWKLAKFQLNEARSTADELTWEEPATGASRVWRRERPAASAPAS